MEREVTATKYKAKQMLKKLFPLRRTGRLSRPVHHPGPASLLNRAGMTWNSERRTRRRNPPATMTQTMKIGDPEVEMVPGRSGGQAKVLWRVPETIKDWNFRERFLSNSKAKMLNLCYRYHLIALTEKNSPIILFRHMKCITYFFPQDFEVLSLIWEQFSYQNSSQFLNFLNVLVQF